MAAHDNQMGKVNAIVLTCYEGLFVGHACTHRAILAFGQSKEVEARLVGRYSDEFGRRELRVCSSAYTLSLCIVIGLWNVSLKTRKADYGTLIRRPFTMHMSVDCISK